MVRPGHHDMKCGNVRTPHRPDRLESRAEHTVGVGAHRFNLDHVGDAYETFGHAASTRALKVIVQA